MKNIDYLAMIVSLIAGVVLIVLRQCHWEVPLLALWAVLWVIITLGLTSLKRKRQELSQKLGK